MPKYVVQCPGTIIDKESGKEIPCNGFAEMNTGIFAIFRGGKVTEVKCPKCSRMIRAKTDTMALRTCSHCGNEVIFDQSKGARAVCPICKNPINTIDEMSQTAEFSCAQCGIRLRAAKSAPICTCPVCDCVNDVAERIKTEQIKHDGLASIIKYEGDNDTFIWKHPIEDFNYGSQLIVHESQEAIFFKDGQALDLFGPGRYTLETQQLPILEKLYKLPTDTEGTFHTEVYFINKTVQMAIKWGTPEQVRFIDPLTNVPLKLGASGELNLMVSDSRKLLLKLVGTMGGIQWGDKSDYEEKPGEEKEKGTVHHSGFTQSIKRSFRPLIANAVKTSLPIVIKNEAIDLLEIDEKIDIISEKLRDAILPGFEEYGLTIPQFYVTNIVLPEDDENFKTIRELHTISLKTRKLQMDATINIARAQSEAQYRTAQEQAEAAIAAAEREVVLEKQTTETEIARRQAERDIIAAQAQAQAKRMDGLAEAEVMHAKGYTQKDVLQADVQKAYAEGIGNMGPEVSNGGGGSSVVGDIVGLGVGMAAATAIAPQLGEMFSGMNTKGFGTQVTQEVPIGWNCACGAKNITSKFCPDCGKPKPAPAESWNCSKCGATNITSKFCPDCGASKPVQKEAWTCAACGATGITSKFCPECGAPKLQPQTWTCPNCGTVGITSKCCPECGCKRGE